MFLEDYKKSNNQLKLFGGYARKKPNSLDTVIVKLGKFGEEYINGTTKITIGGDIAKVEIV